MNLNRPNLNGFGFGFENIHFDIIFFRGNADRPKEVLRKIRRGFEEKGVDSSGIKFEEQKKPRKLKYFLKLVRGDFCARERCSAGLQHMSKCIFGNLHRMCYSMSCCTNFCKSDLVGQSSHRNSDFKLFYNTIDCHSRGHFKI